MTLSNFKDPMCKFVSLFLVTFLVGCSAVAPSSSSPDVEWENRYYKMQEKMTRQEFESEEKFRSLDDKCDALGREVDALAAALRAQTSACAPSCDGNVHSK